MLGTLSYLNTIESNLAGFGRYLSKAVAAILYQNTVGDFVYNVDESGNTVLDNRGAAGSAYDGLPYSGRGIELGATNDVDIPIHHTLGNSTSTYSSSQEGTATPIADGVNIVVSAPTSGSTYPRTFFTLSNTITEGNTYLVSFDVVVNSGTVVNQGIYVGGGTSTQLSSGLGSLTTGHYEVEITVDYTVSDSTLISLSFDGFNNTFDVDITNLISEQITNPNSYLTYYDFTDGLVTLGNSVDGGSSDSAELATADFFNYTTYPFGSFNNDGNGQYTLTGDDALNGATLGSSSGDTISISANKMYMLKATVVSMDTGTMFIEGRSAVFGGTNYIPRLNLNAVDGAGTYYITFMGTNTGLSKLYIGSTSTNTAVIKDISIKEILPISTKYTLNTKTVNNFLTHTTPWSALDWVRINNNPNLVGKLALETLGATKTISELDMELDQGASADSYYMCSEKSGAYLVDSRAGYGAEKLTNGTFNTTVTGWAAFGGGTLTWDADNGGSAKNTNSINLLIEQYSLVTGQYAIVTFDAKTTANVILEVYDGAVYRSVGLPINTTSWNSYSIIIKAASTRFIIGQRGVLATDILYLDNISVREATATEIANYAATVRTNADLQQKGIQTTAFVTDGAGVPTSYSDNLLQFNGDGRYVDTGWIPSANEDWTIEAVTYKATAQTFEGTWGGASNTRCSIGTETNGAIRIDIGSTSKLLAPLSFDSDLYHVEVVYHSSSNTFDVYQNGVIIFASQATDYSAGAITYKYGKYTAALTGTDAPKGSFIFHKNKAHTATEVAAAYAQAKTIYPTLP